MEDALNPAIGPTLTLNGEKWRVKWRELVSTDLLGPSTEREGRGERVCTNVHWPLTQRDGGWEGACVYRCTLTF